MKILLDILSYNISNKFVILHVHRKRNVESRINIYIINKAKINIWKKLVIKCLVENFSDFFKVVVLNVLTLPKLLMVYLTLRKSLLDFFCEIIRYRENLLPNSLSLQGCIHQARVSLIPLVVAFRSRKTHSAPQRATTSY